MKLNDEYEIDEMPEPFVTSCDIEAELDLPEGFGLAIFRYLKLKDVGEVYTQVDAMAANHPDVLYSRGVRTVNRTGVYAFVFKR